MILAGERLDAPPVPCAGLLLIGDPHVASRRPGRRKDPDWPAPVLAKLDHCVALANARDLAPVLLGDLFEHPVEPDESLKARLIRTLKGFRHRPLANVGNHDIRHTRLSDGDSLAVLAVSDVLDAAAESGPAAHYALPGLRLGVGATPYGQPIPADVRGLMPEASRVLWLTHHDLAFGAGYPGAVPPHPIAGCALAVNGHVHKRHPPARLGGTVWFNPGTITRGSVDLLTHAPAVFRLGPDLAPVEEVLPHRAEVFDLTGRQVAPARGEAEPAESAFVSLLSAESATDLARTDDGAVIREAIEAKFLRDGTPEPVRAVIRSLMEEAVARRR
ncbi:hypothetical protein M446_6289 [Methylobacterium sp. 4-46]|uniref:hypothetical protein n=1 Tax=unclassified Methylobacterium TaxID=2615210 RepID=UPI000152CC01|nr:MULTISPECIES: hypothetical protein [Methylobacterium]ACA20555.1 hypothetical protein M446_6289 [Methylobacterium sp. 4-46]WFT79722.1 hypothetical protein QA634_31770 [Methylobacterium nodulans]